MREGPWQIIYHHGGPGERFGARGVARVLCVSPHTVIRWIQRGWLRASASGARGAYLIRRRSVRRLLCDYPNVARVVMAAQAREWRKYHAEQRKRAALSAPSDPSAL